MTTASCINIGPRERRKRMIGGLAALAAAIVLGAVLVATGAARMWRTLMFVPLFGAGLGFFQARAKTCVHLAVRGLSDLDDGPQEITDVDLRAQARRQASIVFSQSLAFAALLATVALLL